MSVDPKDAKPDQPYKVTCGGERLVAQRIAPNDGGDPWYLIPPAESSLAERQVDQGIRDLVPLVPARNVTRDDLPSAWSARRSASKSGGVLPPLVFVSEVLDAVVAHLNERGGIPAGSKPYRWEGFPLGGGTLANDLAAFKGKPYAWGGRGGGWGDSSGAFKPFAENLNADPDVQPKSCCEEAALNANDAKAAQTRWESEFKRAERVLAELSHRNDELAKAKGKIAELTMALGEANDARREWANTCAALRKRAEKAEQECDLAWNLGATNTAKWTQESAKVRELQAKLDAAENRPTLDREAVLRAVKDERMSAEEAADAILALTGQAATSDEDQRVEEQARALYNAVHENLFPQVFTWEDQHEEIKDGFRSTIRAGWTPPENEATA